MPLFASMLTSVGMVVFIGIVDIASVLFSIDHLGRAADINYQHSRGQNLDTSARSDTFWAVFLMAGPIAGLFFVLDFLTLHTLSRVAYAATWPLQQIWKGLSLDSLPYHQGIYEVLGALLALAVQMLISYWLVMVLIGNEMRHLARENAP